MQSFNNLVSKFALKKSQLKVVCLSLGFITFIVLITLFGSLFVFAQDSPAIFANPPLREKWSSQTITVDLEIEDTGHGGIEFRYAWSNDTAYPAGWGSWQSGTSTTATQVNDGTWYLHVEAEDNEGDNYACFGPYRKGSEVLWQDVHGTSTVFGYAVCEALDGGYVIAGCNRSTGGSYLLKVDENGSMQWERSFPVSWEEEYAFAVCSISSPEGYAVVGTRYDEEEYEAFFIRTDINGLVQWSRTFDDQVYSIEARAVKQSADGGFVIVGSKGIEAQLISDLYVIKTDANGLIQGTGTWANAYGGSGYDNGYALEIARDGDFVVAGSTRSYGTGNSRDIYLLKLSAGDGSVIWQRTYGGTGNDIAYAISQDTDGGYIITGSTRSFGNNEQIYLIKTDSMGQLEWQQNFGGSDNETGRSVIQTADGGYAVLGRTNSQGAGGYDMYMIKTDHCGGLQWEKTFGGSGHDYGYDLLQTPGEGYFLVGTNRSVDPWITKIFMVMLGDVD